MKRKKLLEGKSLDSFKYMADRMRMDKKRG